MNTDQINTSTRNRYAIELDHVNKLYFVRPRHRTLWERLKNTFKTKRIHVLKDISVKIPRGINFGIIGLNGSGKSTLLRILAGVSDYDSGSVKINGRIASLLELGAGFHNELTGRENIYLNAALMGFSEEDLRTKLEQIIAFADIGEYIEQPLRTYSSGMKVRLGFSVAIHIDPDILLVDEVLAVGDQDFKQKCIEKILALKEKGVTILLVTHSMSQIRRICDQVACLHDHKLMTFKSIEKGIDFYLTKVRNKTEKQIRSEHQALLDKQQKLRTDGIVRWGDHKGEILDAAILDDTGQTQYTFPAGQGFTCRLDIVFHEDVVDPILGFILKDEKKQRIYNTNTMWRNIPLGKFKAGERIHFTAHFPGVLLGGTYYLTAAIAYPGGERFMDWREDFARFNILETTDAKGIVHFQPELEINGIPLENWSPKYTDSAKESI